MTSNDRLSYPIESSRRQFLKAVVASVPSSTLVPSLLATPVQAQDDVGHTPDSYTTVTPHLLIFHGPIHVGIIRDGNRALIIDCGDGRVSMALEQIGITRIEQLLFTHYHRDQLCGADRVSPTAKRGVPKQEQKYFSEPNSYWEDDDQLYRVYRTFRPDHLMPAEAVGADKLYAGGDQFSFGPATIQVLDTPGHTEGSVSFLVEVDGKRVLFCGDLLADDGEIWDLYSLQKGFQRGDQSVGGYHGFMGDRWQLAESLQHVRECQPDLVVPSHGRLMSNPDKAIGNLIARLERCYENYVSISALRFYFPRLFDKYAGKPGQMPIRKGTEPPKYLQHFGTTWMLVSQTGAALVMDVGSNGTVDQLKEKLANGEIKSIDGLWVTHYHFDHTDGIVEFQRTFDCPCITDQRLADVLVRPAAWRLPCLGPDPIKVHQPMKDGQSWNWHEFKLTSYTFPGQTMYHSALLAEVNDDRMLFVGDSFTPSGLDDYCAHNRNLLGPDVGFQYCLSLVETLQPTHIFNCHVDDAFRFTKEEIAFMRKQLEQREELFGQVTPWAHANFATDPSWVRADPYRQSLKPGQTVSLQVVVTNHAKSDVACACRAVLPNAWGGKPAGWVSRQVSGKKEQSFDLSLSVPSDARPGRYVIPIDVQLGEMELPSFAECLVDLVV